jgi:KAP family P-loop domain
MPIHIRSDDAITSSDQDRLGRSKVASLLADRFRENRESGSFVVALNGPWGSGKTSVINMILEALREDQGILPLRFEPWLFSGTNDLFSAFFHVLAGQLKIRQGKGVQKLADSLEQYGEVLGKAMAIPVAGHVVGVLGLGGQALGRVLNKTAVKDLSGPTSQREALERVLLKGGHTMVIAIDDVDRLLPQEILDLMRLVRLIARLPRTHYLLAYDRHRVEEVLNEGIAGRGRGYLEKIVQVTYDLPQMRRDRLAEEVGQRLSEVAGAIGSEAPLDVEQWLNVLHRGVMPMVSSLRDADRYANACAMALAQLDDEVALQDVFGLEAIRLFAPEVYAGLPEATDALTSTSTVKRQMYGDAWRRQVRGLAASAGTSEVPVSEILQLLFPVTLPYWDENVHYGPEWTPTWRRQGKVASPDVLATYLEGARRDDVAPAKVVRKAAAHLGDRRLLTGLIEDLPDDQLDDLLAHLIGYQDEFRPEFAEPAIAALNSALPRLRTGSGGLADVPPRILWGRLVLRLLRAVAEDGERERVVRDLVVEAPSATAAVWLLEVAGNRENVGHRLIGPAIEAELRGLVATRVAGMAASDLVHEPDLAGVISAVRHIGGLPDDLLHALCSGDAFFARLLAGNLHEVHIQGIGSVAVRTEPQLSWPWLIGNLGEAYIRDRLARLAPHEIDALAERERTAIRVALRCLEEQPSAS